MQIKKGDKVKVLAGNEKGKTGVVLKVLPKEEKVIVEGLNIVKRHRKARKQGEAGKIVEISAPIHISNVQKLVTK